jgi:hypothetical protein
LAAAAMPHALSVRSEMPPVSASANQIALVALNGGFVGVSHAAISF